MSELISWKFFSFPNSLARSSRFLLEGAADPLWRLFIIMMLFVVDCYGAKFGLLMK